MAAVPHRASRPQSPRERARTALYVVSDLLLEKHQDRGVLREYAAAALEAWHAAGLEHGLGSHLLRNLLRDLGEPRSIVERAYYANQLTLAADRIG